MYASRAMCEWGKIENIFASRTLRTRDVLRVFSLPSLSLRREREGEDASSTTRAARAPTNPPPFTHHEAHNAGPATTQRASISSCPLCRDSGEIALCSEADVKLRGLRCESHTTQEDCNV